MNPQPPQDPQQQYQPPYQPVEQPPQSPMGNPFASSDVNFTPHHDRPRISVGKLLKRLSAIVVAFGMIAGIGYGVNYFLGIADREQQAYNARLAEEVSAQTDEAIYVGDGSDILEAKPALFIVGCPAGFSETETGCEKNELISVPAAQYNCPATYTKEGEGAATKCSRIEGGTKESIPATVQATCEAGKTLKNGGCVATEIAAFIVVFNCDPGFERSQLTEQVATCARQEIQKGTLRSGCPSGYTPAGSGCTRTVAATANTSGSCPSNYPTYYSPTQCYGPATLACPSVGGYTPTSDGRCVATVYRTLVRDCPAGTTKEGSGSSTVCARYRNIERPAPCPTGFNRISQTQCKATSQPETYYTACPSDYRSFTTYCTKTANRIPTCNTSQAVLRDNNTSNPKCVINKPTSTTYTCSQGNVSGSNCVLTLASASYCDQGFTRSGNDCLKTTIVKKEPTKQNTCPASFSIASTNCQKENRTAAIQALACGSGYTREGDNCTKIVGGRTVTASPNVTVSCGAGFTQVGAGNDAKCEKRETVTTEPVERQICEEGWSKRIIGTTIDCVRTA